MRGTPAGLVGALLALQLHLDWLEVLWLALALVGLGLIVDELRTARGDCRLLLDAHRRERRRDRRDLNRAHRVELELVRGDIRAAWWLIAFQLSNVLAGIVVAFTPPRPEGRPLSGWVVVALLVFAAAAVPARTFDRRRKRRRLLEL